MKLITSRNAAQAVLLAATLFGTTVANAYQVHIYSLDLSNQLPNGPTYATVKIEDLDNGDIKFTVDPIDTAFSISGSNFGLQKFGFNTDLDPTLVQAAITGPVGWTVGSGNLDGFGSFEITDSGTGSTRKNPLEFTISGISGDTYLNYLQLSSGGSSSYFAAHIAGFDSTFCTTTDQDGCTSAFFAGGDSNNPPNEVPVPAAVWLFGSGLLGMIGIARRRNIG